MTILQIACANRHVRQAVQSEYDLEVSNSELIADTRSVIQLATDFDDRDVNSNFDYEFDAYRAIERNFAHLIREGELAEVMELSIKLMREGSRQVECSDEGMMTHEIEACLGVVIKALKKKSLPASDIVRWCDQMLHQGPRCGAGRWVGFWSP